MDKAAPPDFNENPGALFCSQGQPQNQGHHPSAARRVVRQTGGEVNPHTDSVRQTENEGQLGISVFGKEEKQQQGGKRTDNQPVLSHCHPPWVNCSHRQTTEITPMTTPVTVQNCPRQLQFGGANSLHKG